MESEGYSNLFLLGVLLSRTTAFYIFKRFGEVDPARAHAKVTHTRLSTLPIPKIDFTERREKRLHDEVAELAKNLLQGVVPVGGHEDMRIDIALRELWGLSAEDGLYINLELAQLPAGQVIRDLFPKGPPKRVLKAPTSDDSGDGIEVTGAS
jgi:hypothetical protein